MAPKSGIDREGEVVKDEAEGALEHACSAAATVEGDDVADVPDIEDSDECVEDVRLCCCCCS